MIITTNFIHRNEKNSHISKNDKKLTMTIIMMIAITKTILMMMMIMLMID